jgi:hypothetical protein
MAAPILTSEFRCVFEARLSLSAPEISQLRTQRGEAVGDHIPLRRLRLTAENDHHELIYSNRRPGWAKAWQL